MSKQATFSDDQFQTGVSLDTIEDKFSSYTDGEDAFRCNVEIVLDREENTRVVEWNLQTTVYNPISSSSSASASQITVDRTSELLDHLNADSDDVLSLVREHTDLRTTKIGSNLGYVMVDTDGDIIRFELLNAYPNAPSVKIAHEELEDDLRALNPE